MHSKYDAFEFTAFMEHYLKDHPEVVKDQERGWNIYWQPTRVDQGEKPRRRPASPNKR